MNCWQFRHVIEAILIRISPCSCRRLQFWIPWQCYRRWNGSQKVAFQGNFQVVSDCLTIKYYYQNNTPQHTIVRYVALIRWNLFEQTHGTAWVIKRHKDAWLSVSEILCIMSCQFVESISISCRLQKSFDFGISTPDKECENTLDCLGFHDQFLRIKTNNDGDMCNLFSYFPRYFCLVF